MGFVLNINVNEMLVLTLQNNEKICADADLVIEEDKNQLDSPPEEIGQESGSHPHLSIQIAQSGDWFEWDSGALLQSTFIQSFCLHWFISVRIVQKNMLMIIHE